MLKKKKYYWTRAEEAELIKLWKEGITNFDFLAKELGRTPGAVAKKVERLSLSPQQQTTTSVPLHKDLLTHEQALKILCSALYTLRQSGLDKLELQRLRILVDAIQTYDSVLEKFERWVEIEAQLLEMAKEIAALKKAKINAS
ncbi:MAG: hypothetical protein OEY95_02580 [Candidatus Bathyarchaeota archaeon]|nr:hypothetical protein [Candidatus Bathyarchaeota archaeon]MDH5754080.1 hypothetical protein [Candidatus Bathyarchaeota archaeon]